MSFNTKLYNILKDNSNFITLNNSKITIIDIEYFSNIILSIKSLWLLNCYIKGRKL